MVPDEPGDLPDLERRRDDLYRQLGQVGDFRRGSLNEVRRKCGKPDCACAQPGHPGHGPQYNLTRSENGRTVARHLRPGPELDKARPAAPPGAAGDDGSPSPPGGEKRGSGTRSRRRR